MKKSKIRSIFILFSCLIFFCCDSTEELTPEEKADLEIDHLTKVSIVELKKQIKKIEKEIDEIIRLGKNASWDLELIEEELMLRLEKADSIIFDNQKTKAELEKQINQLEYSINRQEQRLETFRNRNTFQIRIEKLNSEIADVDRDIVLLKDTTLNEIEKSAIKTRYENIFNKIDKHSENNKSENEIFIDILFAWKDSLIRYRNNQVDEFENRTQDFIRVIKLDSNKIFDLNHNIDKMENSTIETQNLIIKLKNDFVRDSINYQKKIKSYKREETILMAKKLTREIAILKQNLKVITNPPREIVAKLKKIDEFHKTLIENLFKYNYDLMKEQFNLLTGMIDDVEWKLAEIQNLEGLVRKIFKDRVFNKFLILGGTANSKNPEFQKSIEEFKMHIYTIKRFLNLYPNHKIYIDGYADPLIFSSDPLFGNKKLSKQRAKSAAETLIKAGIPEFNIVVDWFGEFHTQVNPKNASQTGSEVDRRVDMQIIAPGDTSGTAKTYLKFKTNFEIRIDNIAKSFRHQNGFWIENCQKRNQLDTIKIKYNSEIYHEIVNKHPFFHSFIEPQPSPVFGYGVIKLGNEVKIVLPFENNEYWIIIGEDGVERLDDPEVAPILPFLSKN